MHIADENWNTALMKLRETIEGAIETEGLDAVHRVVATVFAAPLEKSLMKVHGVRRSSSSRGVAALLNKRRDQYVSFPADHAQVWQKDGKPTLFTSEPYGLGREDLRDMLTFCDQNCLHLSISAWSPYFFGQTLLVSVSKPNLTRTWEATQIADGRAVIP